MQAEVSPRYMSKVSMHVGHVNQEAPKVTCKGGQASATDGEPVLQSARSAS